MTLPRHQLAALSPIPGAALFRSARRALREQGPRRNETPDSLSQLSALLCAELSANEAILCASGTQALALAIEGCVHAHGRDTVVALPAYSCFDLIAAAVAADVRIMFYDVDPDTLSPDPASVQAALRSGAGVIVVAPLYGVPVDWRTLSSLADEAGALVIEDAAQGHGADYQGSRLGSFGAVSVLSFGRGKGWTGGRGGALLVRSEAVRARVVEIVQRAARGSSLSSLARATAASLLGRPTVYAVPAAMPWLRLGQTVYHPPSALTLMDIGAAATILETRAAADSEANVRRRNAAIYARRLRSAVKWRHIAVQPGCTPSWLRYPLRLPYGNQVIRNRRCARHGMAIGYPLPLPELPQAAARTVAGPPCTGARELARTLITLPTHGFVSELDHHAIRALLVELPGSTPSPQSPRAAALHLPIASEGPRA